MSAAPGPHAGTVSASAPAADLTALRQLLVDMCTPFQLDGLPFPVAARNRGWLSRLDAICAALPGLGAQLDRVAGLEGPLAGVILFSVPIVAP